MDRDWISQINQLNELELALQINGTIINIEWFRAMYTNHIPNRTWHYHRGTEIHYLMQGEIEVDFEDTSAIVKKGEAIIIPSGVRHRLSELVNQEPFYKIVVNYHLFDASKDQKTSPLDEMLQLSQRERIEISPELQNLLEFAVDECVKKRYGFITVIQGNLLSILTMTARLAAGKKQIDYTVPRKKNVFMERMEQIDFFVKNNLNRKLSAEEIARHMNLSTKQIGRVIFYCYGKNTQQYLMGVKVEKAKELLKNPEYSVGYIAGVLGFCNEYYFNRFFKQAEGMPPGKYRKSIIS